MLGAPDYPVVTCAGCGAEDRLRYGGDVGARMRAYSECFGCAFWELMVQQDAEAPERVAIVDGRHYTILPDLKSGPFRPLGAGFGGALHRVEFDDGRVVETRNLWHQGEVPERFRDRLPDNARFLPEERDHARPR